MVEFLIAKLTDLIIPITNLSKDKRELKQQALSLISSALNETCLYLNRRKSQSRNLDMEENLSRLWANAAIPIANFDKELATICQYKSDYWINPETWSQEEINSFGIRLTEVKDNPLCIIKS